MEEQLPTPLSEILLLNLYLGSVVYLLSILFIIWVLKRNQKLRILRALAISTTVVLLGNIGSLVIWSGSVLSPYLMIGPVHIPAFVSTACSAILVLKISGYKLAGKQTS